MSQTCKHSKDGTHCVHWWDGEKCCYCVKAAKKRKAKKRKAKKEPGR